MQFHKALISKKKQSTGNKKIKIHKKQQRKIKQKRNFSREIFSALDDLKVNKKPSIYEVIGFKRRLDKTLDGYKKY